MPSSDARACANCGASIAHKHSSAVYCSDTCRSRAWFSRRYARSEVVHTIPEGAVLELEVRCGSECLRLTVVHDDRGLTVQEQPHLKAVVA